MASHSGLDSPRLKPVLVYLVTQDWYFMSHRVPMARAAQRAGYDVHVITHVDKDRRRHRSPRLSRPSRGVATGEHQSVRVLWKYQ